MAILDNIRGMFNAGAAPAPASNENTAAPDEVRDIFNSKKQALETASATARSEGRMATLDDYYNAAQSMPIFQAVPDDKGRRSEMLADLSGQTITGYKLSDPQKADTHKPEDSHGKHAMSDMYDQDGDGKINPAPIDKFYEKLKLGEAECKDCYVEPATSFNEQLAKAKKLDNITFKDMREGDKFTFGEGEYKNIRLENIQGGDIAFQGSKIDGLDMQGAKVASVSLGKNTVINNLHAEHAEMVTINAEPGAEIHHGYFKGATVDMAGSLESTRLSDLHFDKSNLHGVSFDGAEMTKVSFNDTSVKGMSFKSATLKDVHFNHVNMQDLDLSGALIDPDKPVTVNGHTIRKPEDLKMATQLEGIRATMQKAVASIGTTTEPAAAAAAPNQTAMDNPGPQQPAAGKIGLAALGVVVGGDVNHDEIAMNTHVASMQRTVPVEHQATAENMRAVAQPAPARTASA